MTMAMTDCKGCSPGLSSSSSFHQQSIQSMREPCWETVDHLEVLPTYEEFFLGYLLPNRPCVLSSRATEEWRSRKDWVTSQGTPDLDFLNKQFGSVIVPVADCSQEKFCSHPKTEMKLGDYITYWKDFIHKQHRGEKLLYLKDWHFARSFPDYTAYKTPVYFKSDWLNEFWDCRTDEGDDYRFVYMGPKGTWTPLHADVFRSYSWSANICGRKKWIFYPPGEERCLTDTYGQLAFSMTSDELHDESKYPNYKHLQQQIEVFQEQGEIIFVPSGWHHQVFNVEDTISINHNWINGCNIDMCWRFIGQCLLDVQKEIADCQDMEEWHTQCQLILKASSGIDYIQFLRFLNTVAQHRLHALSVHNILPFQSTSIHRDQKSGSSNEDKTISASTVDGLSVTSTKVCPNEVKGCDQTGQMTSSDLDPNKVSPIKDSKLNSSERDSNGKSLVGNSEMNLIGCDTYEEVDSDTTTLSARLIGEENICDNLVDVSCSEQRLTMSCIDHENGHHDILDISGASFSKQSYSHWVYCNVVHAMFDLDRLRHVMSDILQSPVVMEIDAGAEIAIANDILKQIKSFLDH